jgi:hypothetical protein
VSSAGDGATAAIRADHYITDHFRAKPATTGVGGGQKQSGTANA